MGEIKEGYYVRLVNGRIRKVIGVYGRTYMLQANDLQDFTCECKKKDIVKYGRNIIEIIEVGDYVNGCNVVEVREYGVVVSGGFGEIYLSQIKNIVTKEQFEKGKYFVKD